MISPFLISNFDFYYTFNEDKSRAWRARDNDLSPHYKKGRCGVIDYLNLSSPYKLADPLTVCFVLGTSPQ